MNERRKRQIVDLDLIDVSSAPVRSKATEQVDRLIEVSEFGYPVNGLAQQLRFASGGVEVLDKSSQFKAGCLSNEVTHFFSKNLTAQNQNLEGGRTHGTPPMLEGVRSERA